MLGTLGFIFVWLNNHWKLGREAQSCLKQGWFAEKGEGVGLRAWVRAYALDHIPLPRRWQHSFLDINRPINICSFKHIGCMWEHSFVHTDEKSVANCTTNWKELLKLHFGKVVHLMSSPCLTTRCCTSRKHTQNLIEDVIILCIFVYTLCFHVWF